MSGTCAEGIPHERDEDGKRSRKLLRRYVRRALVLLREEGQSELYDELQARAAELLRASNQLSGPDDIDGKSKSFTMLLEALAHSVEEVDEDKHKSLLTTLNRCNLWEVPKSVAKAYANLLVELSSSRTHFVLYSMQVLVNNLSPPLEPLNRKGSKEGRNGKDANIPGEPWTPDQSGFVVLECVLQAMHEILRLDPSSTSYLLPIVIQKYPHPERSRDAHCFYACAMMQLAESQPGASLHTELLTSLMEKIFELEIHVDWKLLVEDDAQLDQDHALIGVDSRGYTPYPAVAVPRDQEASNNGGTMLTTHVPTEYSFKVTNARRLMALNNADKLDSLMELLFGHILRQMESGHTEAILQTILLCLKRTILPTRSCKALHFVIFLLGCHVPARASEAFVNLLLRCILEEGCTEEMRVSCCCYLASFLARASFLEPRRVIDVFDRICQWCTLYLECLDKQPRTSTTRMEDHLVYYGCCHCLMYPLCFKLKSLLRGAEGDRLCALPIKRVLLNKLCPFQACLASVVSEFQSQVLHVEAFDLANCDVVEGNAEAALPEATFDFFPFDHFVLKRSVLFLQLEKTFVRWEE